MFVTTTTTLVLLGVSLLANRAAADVYMHNPRGSNDRNCERNDNRNNGNRLFDSNNNDKGGYACPRAVSNTPLPVTQQMYYYEGSLLAVEWTQQHGCGNQDQTQCQLVLQYMCEDQNPGLRDGIPSNDNDDATDRMDTTDLTNTRFGYHETYATYNRCQTRDRNKGLYTADQNLQGNAAIFTRQNPNGNRNGWECPEELDYYPYWHPAPWKDIAIISDDFGKNGFPDCAFFQENSQNVIGTGHCFTTKLTQYSDMNTATPLQYNTASSCHMNGGFWFVAPPLGGGQPVCVKNFAATRPNVLGNDVTGSMPQWTWTIPKISHAHDANSQAGSLCVLRMRYNISSLDVPYNLNILDNYNGDANKVTGPNTDPLIQPFAPFSDPSIPQSNMLGAYNLSLRVNTNQYGRTFQDRSYTFYIRPRASPLVTGRAPTNEVKIINVNVRGKRGNIVQTFPAVEYDFVPQRLKVGTGEMLHFQWTGSDYNPNRQPNNAEGGPVDLANGGNYRADRSNIVQQFNNDPANNLPHSAVNSSQGGSSVTPFFSAGDAGRFAFLNQDPATDCDSWSTLLSNNGNDEAQADLDNRNCYKLNAQLTPYFDGGLVKVNAAPGTYHLFSTRNNNFSNRSQKIVIQVYPTGCLAGCQAGIAVGTLAILSVGGATGGYYYSKKHPNSPIAQVYSNFFAHPWIQRITSVFHH